MTQVSQFAREHRGLLALNALLILVLLVVTFAPVAKAQPAASSPRKPGDYIMVSAKALGFPEAAIWLVDTSNQQLMVVRYDRSTKQLRFLGYRDMTVDARQAERKGR